VFLHPLLQLANLYRFKHCHETAKVIYFYYLCPLGKEKEESYANRS